MLCFVLVHLLQQPNHHDISYLAAELHLFCDQLNDMIYFSFSGFQRGIMHKRNIERVQNLVDSDWPKTE